MGTGGFICTVGGRKWDANVNLANKIDLTKRNELMQMLSLSYMMRTGAEIARTHVSEPLQTKKKEHVKKMIELYEESLRELNERIGRA